MKTGYLDKTRLDSLSGEDDGNEQEQIDDDSLHTMAIDSLPSKRYSTSSDEAHSGRVSPTRMISL